MSDPSAAPPRHLYVHVPFCARRCSYCDFAIAVRRVVPVDEYVGALRAELALRHGALAGGWELETLYFGGGTPSRLGGAGLAAAIAAVRELATLAPGAELTIEANPDDVDEASAGAWAAAGANRLSLGVQSFAEEALAWMHRSHGASRAAEAVRAARAAGIGDVSVDLIFALPGGVPRTWQGDLEAALALEPDHVSLYGLTVEPSTPLGRWHERGEVREAEEERYEAEFLRAHETLAAAGFEHYEVSNYARPGRRSRHNGSYWRGVPYAGVGPSAHAYDGRVRRWNVPAYAEWARRLSADETPTAGEEELTAENRAAETVYLGLRTSDGLTLEAGESAIVEPWAGAGWVVVTDGVLRLTPLGWLRLDSLAASLTAHRSR